MSFIIGLGSVALQASIFKRDCMAIKDSIIHSLYISHRLPPKLYPPPFALHLSEVTNSFSSVVQPRSLAFITSPWI